MKHSYRQLIVKIFNSLSCNFTIKVELFYPSYPSLILISVLCKPSLQMLGHAVVKKHFDLVQFVLHFAPETIMCHV